MTGRKELFRFGPAGQTVRGKVSRDETRVLVLWTERGEPRQKSWPNTTAGKSEARAWARGFAESRSQVGGAVLTRISLRALWKEYETIAFPDLAERSRTLYADDWTLIEQFFGRDTNAEDLTVKMVAEFRARLDRLEYAVSSVGRIIQTLKRVVAWGEAQELVGRNRIHLYRYKVPKARRVEPPDEYTPEERSKIIAVLSPAVRTQWRAWVALSLCQWTGERQNAVLHLRWSDIDEAAGEITWPAEFNKLGKEWTQPMREGTKAALEVARQWRNVTGYAGPWVLPKGSAKGKGETYTSSALWSALKAAEAKAGVERKARRGAHGYRRGLTGDVLAETGDPLLALQAVGDSDIRMAKHYLKKRNTRVVDAFKSLDAKVSKESKATETEAKGE